MIHLLWLIPLGFLIGSIPVGYLIALARGVNIRQHGSGNIGSTNVGRVLGRRWGFLCFACDTLKGALPVIIGGLVLGCLGQFQMDTSRAWAWLAIAASPIMGHVFCPWLKFNGGKGVATSLGAFLAMFPAFTLPMAGAALTWLVVVFIWRYVSLGSLAAAALLPIYTLVAILLYDRHQPTLEALFRAHPFLVAAGLLTLMVTLTHLSNISRLIAGTERKVWQGDRKPAEG